MQQEFDDVTPRTAMHDLSRLRQGYLLLPEIWSERHQTKVIGALVAISRLLPPKQQLKPVQRRQPR